MNWALSARELLITPIPPPIHQGICADFFWGGGTQCPTKHPCHFFVDRRMFWHKILQTKQVKCTDDPRHSLSRVPHGVMGPYVEEVLISVRYELQHASSHWTSPATSKFLFLQDLIKIIQHTKKQQLQFPPPPDFPSQKLLQTTNGAILFPVNSTMQLKRKICYRRCTQTEPKSYPASWANQAKNLSIPMYSLVKARYL